MSSLVVHVGGAWCATLVMVGAGRLYADAVQDWRRTQGHDGGEAMAAARRDIDTAPE